MITNINEFKNSVNESKYFIETAYTDERGNRMQHLGTDGTTILKNKVKSSDITQHIDNLKKLKNIKPFLFDKPVFITVKKDGHVIYHKEVNLNENV